MHNPEDPAEVLLVEDSPDDAAFFIHAFGKTGLKARLHIVKDGAEALDFVFEPGKEMTRQLKLVVLDLNLPKVGGLGVLRALRTDPRTQTFPVVVLSSSQEARDLAECYRLGVNSYIVKPMEFDAYAEIVATLARYWIQVNHTPRS